MLPDGQAWQERNRREINVGHYCPLQFNYSSMQAVLKALQRRTCTTVQFNGSVQGIFESYIRLWLVGWLGTFPAYCRASSLVNV